MTRHFGYGGPVSSINLQYVFTCTMSSFAPSGNRNCRLFLPCCILTHFGDAGWTGQWKHSWSMAHWLLWVMESWLVTVWDSTPMIVWGGVGVGRVCWKVFAYLSIWSAVWRTHYDLVLCPQMSLERYCLILPHLG